MLSLHNQNGPYLQINITLAAGFYSLLPELYAANEQFNLKLKIIKCSTGVINNVIYNIPIKRIKLHLSSINNILIK